MVFQKTAVGILAQDVRVPSLLPQLQWIESHPCPKMKPSKDKEEGRKAGKAGCGVGRARQPLVSRRRLGPRSAWGGPVTLFSSPRKCSLLRPQGSQQSHSFHLAAILKELQRLSRLLESRYSQIHEIKASPMQ